MALLPDPLPPPLLGLRRGASPPPMPSRSVRVPVALEADASRLAAAIGCSRSDVLRRALELGLQQISALAELDAAQEAADHG